MQVEMIEEDKDNGRLIVPYTTSSGLQIGVAWTPKLTPQQASCGSRHTRRGRPIAWWVVASGFALLALLVISGRV